MSFERIRKIENELETGQQIARERSVIHDVKIPKVPESWDTPSQTASEEVDDLKKIETLKVNWFKRVFILSILFAVIGGGFFGFSQFFSPKNVSDKNVVVSVSSRASVDGGESFPVTVVITNKNKTPLEYIKVSLEYPLAPGGELNGLYQEKLIDSIGPGEIKELPFALTLYGVSNTSRKISARVSYRVPGSVALFESSADTETILRSSPVRLAIEGASEISPNQEILLTVRYASNLKTTTPSSMFKIDYPTGFVFSGAEPKPDIGNNTWKIGTLIPGSENTIVIKGTMGGLLGENRIFSGSIGSIAQDQNDFESVYATAVSQSQIRQSFLGVSLEPAGGTVSGDKYVLKSGGKMNMRLTWVNTQSTPITNAQIKVLLSGNIFNPDNLNTGTGFYDSNTNTITWTSSEVPQLKNIAPGETGEVEFDLDELLPITSQGKQVSDPQLSAAVSVSGFSSEGKKLELLNIVKQNVILATDAHMAATLYTTKGPIKNTGPIPPKAETQTTYTVNWKLSNTINPLENATVSTVLPQWVKYTGVVSPQSAEQFVSYNETTRVLTWSPGLIPVGTGYTLDPVQVFFQVSIKPSSSQVGQSPALTGPAVFSGRDQKLSIPINTQTAAITTSSNTESKGIIVK